MTNAAVTDFRFRHYTVDDGLPSSTVRAIAQDKFGFIWFGTDNGLCRYDGIEICQYSIGDGINDQSVSCLYDNGTQLWIGTFHGIFIYNYTSCEMTKFTAHTLSKKGVDGDVLSINGDHDGNVWIATMGEGLFLYSPKDKRLSNYPMKSIGGKVNNVMTDNTNQVWAITNNGMPAVWKFNKARNNFSPVYLSNIAAANACGQAIMQSRDGNIWIGTWSNGLVCINSNGQAEAKSGFRPQHIHSIADYSNNQLLVGSDDGLALYNTASETWRTFVDDELNNFSLSDRFVYPIVADREGGVWIGTFYGGINYLVPNANKFASFTASRLHNSVSGNVINRFCEDNNGNIWIASDDGGLSKLNPQTNQFTVFTPQNSGLSYINVHALCTDGNKLWIGTYTGGVNRLDTPTGRFVHYDLSTDSDNSTAQNSCYSIFKDSRGRIWATSFEDLFLFDTSANRFKFVKSIGALTIDIDEDLDGNLWLSTQGKGLFRYTPKTSRWKKYQGDNENNILSTNQVNATLIDTDGNIIIATQDGLCQYNKKADIFEPIDLGIRTTNIQGIVEDNKTYWLATTEGLIKYSPGEPCQLFTKADGLQSDQSLSNAMFKASDGRIYIGSQNGFNAFYPFELTINKTQPNIYITRLEVLNKSKNEVGEALINIVVQTSNEIELPHDANAIAISFASLSYCAPSKNQYMYKLDGFDRSWINSNRRTRATYTNLPPGSYTFRVRGTNNDGVWCKEEATLKITVKPPFFLSQPMKTLYFLLALAALYLGVVYMLRLSNRKHKQEIRRIKAEQEKEVREAKIQFFTMIAHEIRTPVSLIIGPLENIMKSPATIPAKIRDNMDIIDRNAHRLLYLVNQLLDFRKVQTNCFVAHFKRNNIKQLIEAVSERFKPTFDQKGIKFDITYPASDFTAIIDQEAITKVLSNLLTNANKYTRDNVSLECMPNDDGDTFTIIVADNGMGVRQEDRQRIFQPFYQAPDNKPGTGIGLSIVKSIVDQHNGTVSVNSVYGVGSTFTVTLPISQPNIDTMDESGQVSDEKAKAEMEKNETVREMPLKTKDLPTMLIVEDNDDMQAFIESNFHDDYNIIIACDGAEGLEKLKCNDVTLILSDWMMPQMSGIELCKAVRHDPNICHIPFILLTAKTDDESKATGMECGADIYIEKPFSMQVLKSSIANMIELRRMLRERFTSRPMEPITRISNNPLDADLLQTMQHIIEDNLDNGELNVSFIAERLGISRSALFSKIKTMADVTPNEMIQMVRLKTAAKMLSNGNLSVAEISYKVGFSSPSYFTKCFQKQFGMKPAEMGRSKKQKN